MTARAALNIALVPEGYMYKQIKKKIDNVQS